MKPCSVPDCTKPLVARGFCNTHYSCWRRTGDPVPRLRPWSRQAATCIVDGCQKAPKARSLCDVHYQRWRVHGDPLAYTRRQSGPCLINGCDGKYASRGYCQTHLARLKRHGDPLYVAPVKPIAVSRYESMHSHLQRRRTGRCSIPGCENVRTEMALLHGKGHLVNTAGTNRSLYSDKVEHYVELCSRCHHKYDRYEIGVSGAPLRWWLIGGNYAEALVAAETAERALELVEASAWGNRDWDAPSTHSSDLPGHPTVEGVYHVYGE